VNAAIKDLLAVTPLFTGASAADISALAERAHRVKLPAKSTLFRKGDVGDRLYLLIKGMINIGAVSADGRDVAYALIGPGEIFGEIAVLDGGPRTADATALHDCELLAIERRDLLAFFDRSPVHATRLLEVLCKRIRSSDRLLESLFFLAAPSRLARHLVMLSDTIGQDSSDGSDSDITIHLSQQQVADHVGISREMVNKILAKWEQAGLVALWRGKITVKNLEALDNLGEN
jgi:CRP/FNR family transcriptional regulator, cyclic AMP receptor protein